jgi:rhamnosyltransferase
VSAPAKGVVAVIVTYRPDAARVERILQALTGDVSAVVIVDNGSDDIPEERWRGSFPALVLRRLAANRGVAVAQNVGVAEARQLGALQVLLLDQDSIPAPGMVPALHAALEALAARKMRAACVGPQLRRWGSSQAEGFTRVGWLSFDKVISDAATECDFLIASGSLIPVAMWDEVGGMEECFFIDLVDTEWCLRARSRGLRIYGIAGAFLEHTLGEPGRHASLGEGLRLARHEPVRYYYMFRNTLLLWRRPYVPLKIVLFQLKWLVGLFLVFGVLGVFGGRYELRMMLRGITDGLRGVTGKLHER